MDRSKDNIKNRLFLNNEASKILGITSRQIISWTEKGLIIPEKPAKKAGSKRGYSYKNLLEFGLARYLLDIVGLQFYQTKTILDEMREDGEFNIWANNYSQYYSSFSTFATRIKDKEKNLLVGSIGYSRECGPEKLGETAKEKGTLYYFLIKNKSNIESNRIIYPGDIREISRDFCLREFVNDMEDITAIIVVNLGKIKQEIDNQIDMSG